MAFLHKAKVFNTEHMGWEWKFCSPLSFLMGKLKQLSNMISLPHYVNPCSCTEASFQARCCKPVVWAVFCAAYLPHSTSPKSTLNHMGRLPHCLRVSHTPHPHTYTHSPSQPEFFFLAYIFLCWFISLCLPFPSLCTVSSPSFSAQQGGDFLTLWLCAILCANAQTFVYFVCIQVLWD